MTLRPSDFATFFETVHGVPPFAWQAALAERVLSGAGWPQAVDVPTGMGKTALLDIAVFALALQASDPAGERTAPTRTFFVVDRRVIVDQAFDRARKIARALGQADSDVVREVAAAFAIMNGGEDAPLVVARMRGGITWNWRWLRSPDQPAVVVGTVDQLGSRLLFRGYGLGTNLRPIDAALVGTDALLILDEAHLSRPLVETARAVHRYESVAERPLLLSRRPAPVIMSATLPPELIDVHRLDPASETSGTAQQRLRAVKLVTTAEVTAPAKDPLGDMAEAMAGIVLDRLDEKLVDRVAVVCNTVRLARGVHRLLAGKANADVCLLTGRCRDFDRQRLANKWGPQLAADPVRPERARPLIAVATQTIEVGADFDVDLLVTEAAPLDALLQRLGRLNRLGLRGEARAVVLHCERWHSGDPVYGPATNRAWTWLSSTTGDVPAGRAKEIPALVRHAATADLGPLASREVLKGVDIRELLAETPLAPKVLGPTLAAWARTNPEPDPDQPVAPFLHGLDRDVPQVHVCWRAGLPEWHLAGAAQAWADEMRTVPVSAGETLEVPLWEARRFLAGAAIATLSDLEGVDDPEEGFEETRRVQAGIVRSEDVQEAVPRALRPGDLIVVRAEEGGHDEWGWTGAAGAPVTDVGDLCQRNLTLRLRPGVVANTVGGELREWSGRLGPGAGEGDDRSDPDRIMRALEAVASAVPPDAPSTVALLVVARASELKAFPVVFGRRASGRATAIEVEGLFPWLVVTAPAGAGVSHLSDRDGDVGDTSSSAAPARVSLERHLLDVGSRAGEIAERLGLPDDLAEAVELAGRWHDLGKADDRFQAMLHGGRLRADASGDVLAKSGMDPQDRAAFGNAAREAGWPAGARHEAISAELVAARLSEDPDVTTRVDGDLVLHLVATHHGHARPLLPAIVDPAPRPVTVALPGSGGVTTIETGARTLHWEGPARFERLGRRYGWWGLALLETIVRLADIACSEGYAGGGRDGSG